MLLRVPVGMAMGLVGVSGYAYLTGGAPALKLIGQVSMRTVTDYQFGVIPMFLLMGAFVSHSGVSRELFRAANTLVGHWRGGLGIATVFACGGFAAISGSSVATAATFSTVAYPEMRRYGYPQELLDGRDRGRRHAGRHAAALDRARRLRPHHPAGCRQAVPRRHRAGHPRHADVHGDHRRHLPCQARLAADRAQGQLERARGRPARRLGAAAAVRAGDRRALRRRVHADRGRRRRRQRRLPAGRIARPPRPRRQSAPRCCRPRGPPPRCSPC